MPFLNVNSAHLLHTMHLIDVSLMFQNKEEEEEEEKEENQGG